MIKQALGLVCVAVGVACGGADAPQCNFDAVPGTYRVNTIVTGGNCSGPADYTTTLADLNADVDGCSNHTTMDKPSCAATTDSVCSYASTATRHTLLNLEPDGTIYGHQTLSIVEANGAPYCSGTFFITYTRQP